ncbi:hypothetical protein D3C75_1178610 [compost metagenome]
MLGSALPNRNMVKTIADVPPAAAASIVFKAMTESAESAAFKVLPALKPNQPNQRINVPADASGILLGANTFTLPSVLNLPRRGPRTLANAKAAAPPSA